MKRQVSISILACISLIVLQNCDSANDQTAGEKVCLKDESEGTHFRKSRWGMSREQVIALENEPPVRDFDTSIVFTGRVAGRDVLIWYIFIEDILVGALYQFKDEYQDPQKCFEDFDMFKNAISFKYGAPSNDNTLLIREKYADNINKLFDSIESELIKYESQWKTMDSFISLQIISDNQDIILAVGYTSLKYYDLFEKAFNEM